MDKNLYNVYSSIQNNWCYSCDTPDEECGNCFVKELLNSVAALEIPSSSALNEGCHICIDKRGKTKEVFYDSDRGGIGIALYCPNCGRKL